MGERHQSIVHFLSECAKKYEDESIKCITFDCSDRGNEDENRREYSMCYNKQKPILKEYCGIDWTFHHWPSAGIQSFEALTKKIMELSDTLPTIDKVGWRGNIHSALNDVVEHETRPLLKQIGDKHPELFDIVHVHPRNGTIGKHLAEYMPIEGLLAYRYLIDIGGNGYSGRLKYLLFSKRPILLVDRDYVEYFHDLLIPYVHFIPVEKNLEDLLEKVQWMIEHGNECAQIALNAYNFAVTNFTSEKLLERVHDVCTRLRTRP